MNKLALTTTLLLFTGALFAQMVSITYDYELNRFTENEPLPAETSFLINGAAPENVTYVEVSIYTQQGRENREPLSTSSWKQPFDRTGNTFHVPISYKLQEDKTYDLGIRYFRPIDSTERVLLFEQLNKYLRAYLWQSFEIRKGEIRLVNSPKQTYKSMNTLVTDALQRYRGTVEPIFRDFSDIALLQLQQADGKEVKDPDFKQDTASLQDALPVVYGNLQNILAGELKFALNKEIVVLTDQRYIDNYDTENRPGYFGLNVGYGASFFGGEVDNPNYDSGLYLALGVPLSTSRIAPKFLRNASLLAGVFVNNLEDDQQREISGPVLGRPYFLGLDYKLFSFVRINAGAALLERRKETNGSSESVLIRPFVGISGKINISLSLDR